MSRDRDPQIKKQHSLQHDRRNTYGENSKSSRTSIRLRKRLASRMRRQALRRALGRSSATAEDTGVDVPAARGQWRKSPDTDLGRVLYLRRLHHLHALLRAHVRIDPACLDRLGSAAIQLGLDERSARDAVAQLRADFIAWRRDAPRIPDDALALLIRLARDLG